MSVASRATTATTIAEAFRITAEDHPDRVAVRTKDDEVSFTWSELRDRVDALAGALAELGVRRGDRVALMLANRPEFHVADLAVMTLGATPFSIYGTYSPEQIAFVVGDAGAKVALIESAFADAFRAADTAVEHLLVLEDGWPSVEGFDAEPHWRAIEPEDVVTLIYTSGTTGPPKGVQLVHRNLVAAARLTESLIQFPDGAKVISWLPAAHIAERMAHHYLPIVYAMTVTSLPRTRARWSATCRRSSRRGSSPSRGSGRSSRPGWRASSCRATTPPATGRGSRRRRARSSTSRPARTCPRTSRGPSRRPTASCSPACGRCSGSTRRSRSTSARRRRRARCWSSSTRSASRWPSCGACRRPAARAPATRPGRVKIGTVGPAGPGVEVRLADDGELLIRSDVVMTGYRNAPDKTSEAHRRRRLAAHRRHRGDRRGRLHPDRRPQEGDHHQRRRQEHVAGEHRVDAEGLQPADRPGVRDRRRPALQHGADRARLRLRARLGGAAGDPGDRPRGARARRARARGGPGRRRPGQREARPRRGRSRSSPWSRATGRPAATRSRPR